MDKQQLFALLDKYKAWVDYADENGVKVNYGALSGEVIKQSEVIKETAKNNKLEPDSLEEILASAPKGKIEKKRVTD